MSSNTDDSNSDSSLEPVETTVIGGGKSGAGTDKPLPMPANEDAEHLRLLSIFHYVVAGITALLSLFPLLHLAIGIAILSGALDDGADSPPPFVGWFFILLSLTFILCGLAMALLIAIAGRKLQRRTGYTYCLVVAAVECLFMPVGTVLGVFTIIVLMRPSVKKRFGVTAAYP